ncbi:hypothetical protein [Lysobacter gummosus]
MTRRTEPRRRWASTNRGMEEAGISSMPPRNASPINLAIGAHHTTGIIKH